MKFCLWFLIWVCFHSGYAQAQQYYDSSECNADTINPGSRYTCGSFQGPCKTFFVYRANQHFQTVSDVSVLFGMVPNDLLQLSRLTSPSDILEPGREVLVPINCSCSGKYFQANFSYTVPENTSFSEIACGVFEGLVKSKTLGDENPSGLQVGTRLLVPLRCACPDADDYYRTKGVKYLVTYPFVEGDGPIALSRKFGISPEDLWAANHFESKPTVFPNTTFLVPIKTDLPIINSDIPATTPPNPGFLPTITVEKSRSTKLRNLYIAGSVAGFSLLVAAVLGCGLYIKALGKWKCERFQSFNGRSSPVSFSTARSSPRSGHTGRSSTNSCLSPDLLAGIKFSLYNYSIEDIRKATKCFSEDTKINDQVYKGLIDNAEVIIKQMKFDYIRQVIDAHSKINHKNILNLNGVCYGENDFSWSYLVFEFPSNGCLRDCLSDPSSPLRWLKRTQIAFDIATGLHYLHYCIFPSYAHMSVNSRSIFVTSNWRAKLGNIGATNGNVAATGGWVAPEYLADGSASEKLDIFAFGVVLLELISGREVLDGKRFKDSIGFLGGGGASEGGCFEQLRSFIDPSLKEDYPLAEALCLAVLAKACVEDDPLHRPSMDDIMKVLARMV